MAWPHDDEQWVGMLEPVRREFSTLVDTIARFEPVNLLVADDESDRDARSRLSAAAIRIHRVPHQDVWLRDSGPIFVSRKNHLVLVDWEFNGWGGKYPADLDNQIPTHVARILDSGSAPSAGHRHGGRIARCQRQRPGDHDATVSADAEAEPALSEPELEAHARGHRLQEVVWLDDGLEGDHTDGHVDTITRFVDEGRIVTSICDDRERSEPRHAGGESRTTRTAQTPTAALPIVELPIPADRLIRRRASAPDLRQLLHRQRRRLRPVYGTSRTIAALEILRPLFPDREVVAMIARALITGGGAFHCVTQQQPVGRPWRAA